MLFWQEGKVILYIFNPPFDFEVKDSFKCQPKFMQHSNGIMPGDITSLILNRHGKLSFYAILNAEESIEEKKSKDVIYKNKVFNFFLHPYFDSVDHEYNKRCLESLTQEVEKSSFIKFSEIKEPESLRLNPFATVIPLPHLVLYRYKDNKKDASANDTYGLATWIEKTHHIPIFVERGATIIESLSRLEHLNNRRLEFISEEVGTHAAKMLFSKMLVRELDHNKVELKSPNQVVFPTVTLTDDKERLQILKGIEYYFEEVNGKQYIVLNNTNFLRSFSSISKLNIREPIDHLQHQFVNIKNGSKLPKKVLKLNEVRNPDDYFETFNTTDAYESDGGSGFSERAFYFQQTNLEKTISLIAALANSFSSPFQLADLSKLGEIDWQYHIIQRKKKYVFRDGEVFYTSSKGLYHAGVLEIPRDLKLQLLISKKVFELGGELRILKKVNEAIHFLYKDAVPPVLKEDLLIYDYNNFSHLGFYDKLDRTKRVITYLVNPSESKHKLNLEQKEMANSINNQLIDIVKGASAGFVVVGEIDLYVFANAILKMGLRDGAIPWKLDAIDPHDADHIFMGIDLGHNHKQRKSNLTITAINNQGCLIDFITEKDLDLNEQLSYDLTLKVFKRLFTKIAKKKLSVKNITIHRDGRFFENVSEFIMAITTAANTKVPIKLNVVEVIKNEVPLIGFKNGDKLQEGFEGLYFVSGNTSYLITNDQSLNTHTSPKPLKIRKVHGDKTIQELTEEVFWLTKPYSVNLFIPSKLPLTTLLANNFAYSRDLLHFITA